MAHHIQAASEAKLSLSYKYCSPKDILSIAVMIKNQYLRGDKGGGNDEACSGSRYCSMIDGAKQEKKIDVTVTTHTAPLQFTGRCSAPKISKQDNVVQGSLDAFITGCSQSTYTPYHADWIYEIWTSSSNQCSYGHPQLLGGDSGPSSFAEWRGYFKNREASLEH
ncbi:hypothetical protein JB92DRAFT_3096996 [Gautieria morchelliformis]|nr:hypothetical protein JB92DRAFT_3096996 [Gautieria morchelliformis]